MHFEASRAERHRRLGVHGRMRRGDGQEFWQFREAVDGDPARLIDWRRSARSDTLYVRERELQTEDSILFWVDRSRSMEFSGARGRVGKAGRARVVALAAAMLFARAEERVGLLGTARAHSGRRGIESMALDLLPSDESEYGSPPTLRMPSGGQIILISDFLSPIEHLERFIERATERGAGGVVIRILDPLEAEFPFSGRMEFHSVGGSRRFKTRNANDVRSAYLERLADHWRTINSLAVRFGWGAIRHSTGDEAASAMTDLAAALTHKV